MCSEFSQCCWDAGAEGINNSLHELLALGRVFLPVGGNHALVNSPRCLHLYMRVSGKQVLQTCALFIVEQVSASMPCSECLVEPLPGTSAMPAGGLLDAPAAVAQRISS